MTEKDWLDILLRGPACQTIAQHQCKGLSVYLEAVYCGEKPDTEKHMKEVAQCAYEAGFYARGQLECLFHEGVKMILRAQEA